MKKPFLVLMLNLFNFGLIIFASIYLYITHWTTGHSTELFCLEVIIIVSFHVKDPKLPVLK